MNAARLPVVALAVAASLLGLALARAGERSVRGRVFEVSSDGSFRLENGFLVKRSPATAVLRGGAPYTEMLLVGLEVEVTGVMGANGGGLDANRVVVFGGGEGRVQGTAIVEERRETPEGLLILADGRKLLISGKTRRLSREQAPEGQAASESDEALSPGAFIFYRGRWMESGWVEVAEYATEPNRLEEREKALYDHFRPTVLLAKNPGGVASVLRVGGNRYTLLDDREMQLYVDRLGTRLEPPLWQQPDVAERLGYPLWFLVAMHPARQASAFPSGVVVIHTGLFQLAENEAQLAFAVGHELAHVLQEHAWRESGYHRKKLLALRWSTAGLGYVVESAIRGGYQRELEDQADRLALAYMARAGYDPREALRFLRHLEERQEGLSSLLWEKHRSYGARRQALMDELVHYSAQGLAYDSLSRTSADFALFRGRIPTSSLKLGR
ncbi:MAG: M48 family metallopeptidase [Candidatus Acidiferrales bacterium]